MDQYHIKYDGYGPGTGSAPEINLPPAVAGVGF